MLCLIKHEGFHATVQHGMDELIDRFQVVRLAPGMGGSGCSRTDRPIGAADSAYVPIAIVNVEHTSARY